MVEDEDSSDDDDDFDYVASTAKNVKLLLLMQKKKAKEKEKMVQQEQDNWKGYALEEDIRKQEFLKGKQLTQIEAKQAAEKHEQDEIDRFNWEKRAKRKGKQGTQVRSREGGGTSWESCIRASNHTMVLRAFYSNPPTKIFLRLSTLVTGNEEDLQEI